MNPSRRLEQSAFYVFLVTVILVPLIFIPSQYVALDLVKSVVIAFGTIAAATLLGFSMYKEKKITLPTRSLLWLSVLIIISLIISAFGSANISKAFFGQGFETSTVSFVALLFLAAYVAFSLVRHRVERAGVLYAALAGTYVILFLFHALRFIIGPSFGQLTILNSLASTFFGSWSSLGAFSFIIALVSFSAIIFLPLSSRLKIAYWVLTIIAAFWGFVVFRPWVMLTFTATLFILAIFLFVKHRKAGHTWKKSISWLPTIAFVVFLLATFWGAPIANTTASSVRAVYTEFVLPWQYTLDIGSEAIKVSPLFGIGPNHFGQAFLSFKPLIINTSDLWGIEFNSGVGTLPTLFVNQGVVGGVLWLLLLIFIGYLGVRSLRRLPDNPYGSFVIISSYLASAFSWLTLLAYSPSHSFLFVTFVITGIWVGAATHYGIFHTYTLSSETGGKIGRSIPVIAGALIVIVIVWGLVYVKKTVAMAYFASGVKHLTQEGDISRADSSFAIAAKLDPSDIYWQARSEAGLARIRELAGKLNGASQASSTQIATEITSILEQSLKYADQAVAVNPTNYYNYLSSARVSEMALNFKIANSYESTIQAYTAAIQRNPFNPSLYLNIARVEASQGKYDNALRAIGSALQVKQNYTDAAFMASQVAAAQGNIADAITAARVATQLSPTAPLTFFQLGILEYTNKNYTAAVEALEKAVSLQNEYANARYFLGLSYARLGRTADGAAQFEELLKTNPDNQEVTLILDNLKSGRSPFTDAQPPVTSTPESRPTPPLKEKR